jgi:hypothetical protein
MLYCGKQGKCNSFPLIIPMKEPEDEGMVGKEKSLLNDVKRL